MSLTRREMALGLGAFTLLPGFARADTSAVNRQAALSAALLRKDTLAASAARVGILFGSAAEWEHLYSDEAYALALAREGSIIVPEVSLKPAATRARPDGFDFSRAERLMSFAVSHKLAFRGHALVWYATVPEWAKTTLTSPAQARAELLLEVTEPCRHFRGRMDSWDVVNEVVDPKSPNGLRASFWLQMIGPDYIPLAFTAARQADPSAILVLNENHLEYDIPSNEQKREAVLDLLRALRRDNVPVDALGIEAHLAVSDKFPFNPSVFDGFLSQVHELGLKILITEMDVNDDALPADIPARDSAVAKAYGDFLGVVLRHPGVVTVTVWGLSDRHTWISTFGPRADGVPVRPTLLDSNLARKPAYFAVQTAFNGASLSGVQNRLRPGWAYMK